MHACTNGGIIRFVFVIAAAAATAPSKSTATGGEGDTNTIDYPTATIVKAYHST